ncbi:RDD family protein [Rodentibacter myodis]|uniref:RDD domain-containing protein n=1 Tax=Rodentibacter myodis TaxID=1907939 RepID=A0A1V3JRY2_9PAST|nr:RDD family protein [Rodentibacter myodis]OOF59394.1 hypothetical protein BKL49_04810 [Rodentibacter myodis]
MLIENQHDSDFTDSSALIPAGRFKRWLASMINGLLLWLIPGIGFVLGDFGGLLFTILYVALQIYFMKTYGQTIAKRWLGLRVFDYNTQHPITLGKYIGREVIDLLFAWTGFLIIISGIVALVRDDRRSLTDLLIGSVVVKDE